MTEEHLRFEGICFRHSAARYATVDEGTLEASMRAGGRFNPAGEFGAVYVALGEDTAVAELGHRIGRTGLPRKHFRPRMMLQLGARLGRVLDLTDPAVRSQLDVTVEAISGPDWGGAQDIARQAGSRGTRRFASRLPQGLARTWPSSWTDSGRTSTWRWSRSRKSGWSDDLRLGNWLQGVG